MKISVHTLMAALAAAALGLVLSATVAIAAGLEIKTKDGVGSYLADDKGMTLYLFKKDGVGMSACSGGCVEKWPLFYQESVIPPAGVAAADFGSIKRDDGKLQTTYKGAPLYYYVEDKAPGDVNGQGLREVWYVVAP